MARLALRTAASISARDALAKAIEVPADVLAETVARYNELAHAGKDTDFSKVSSRLFPIENGPFYAIPFGDSGMLVLIGGIDCDPDLHALDAEKNVVEGHRVAGNTMGNAFSSTIPLPLQAPAIRWLCRSAA